MVIHRMIGGFFGLYNIVPPDEAHVRVLMNKKEVFMGRGKEGKSSYWFIPFLTKMTKLPLTNIRIEVPDVKLNDADMAKFTCDIVCFVNISDPILAAERTGITTSQIRYEGEAIGIKNLSQDFQAIMESVLRTVATKQTILDIYKDRSKLDSAVTTEVEKVFPNWGLQLVDLEIIDIKDAPNSTIIADIEAKQAAKINADQREKTAIEKKRAEIAEAENTRDAELKKAETQETYVKRQIQKDREIAIAQQEKDKLEAEKRLEANVKSVEAERSLQVGMASVEREAVVQRSEAEKSQLEIVAKGQAQQIELTGKAEASAVLAKKLAEAEGTLKQAEAQQKFNDAATQIELIKANKDVEIARAQANAEAFKNGKVNIVAGSTQELLSGGVVGNVSVGPKQGVALDQFLEQNPSLKGILDKFIKSDKKSKM